MSVRRIESADELFIFVIEGYQPIFNQKNSRTITLCPADLLNFPIISDDRISTNCTSTVVEYPDLKLKYINSIWDNGTEITTGPFRI